jgi:nitrous oxide reductase accessory protein NosL
VLWFRDADTGDWIGAGAEPAFVHAESIHTPMGGGIAAFGSRQAAVAFAAAQGGTVIDSAADLLRGAR